MEELKLSDKLIALRDMNRQYEQEMKNKIVKLYLGKFIKNFTYMGKVTQVSIESINDLKISFFINGYRTDYNEIFIGRIDYTGDVVEISQEEFVTRVQNNLHEDLVSSGFVEGE